MARDPSPFLRLYAVISGRVQGVFYRAWAREVALKLNLTGWVRNRDDGCVELTVEGPREYLESLIERCWKGPPSAQVTDIQCTWEEASQDLEPFQILH
jgi:acylphosphatase